MRLHTAALFQLLLLSLRPQVVCDIGSKDGYHARRFRKLLPNARIIAFEANPHNVTSMQADKQLTNACIEVHHKAVSNRNGTLVFNVEEVSAAEPGRQGISSTRRRVKDSLGVTEVQVEAVRLDAHLRQWPQIPETIALWIDVEGGTFEVLEGMQSIRDRVQLLQVEVETEEMWLNQKLKPEVQALMKRMDFVEVARGMSELQHDLIFVSRRTYVASFWKLKPLVMLAMVIHLRLASESQGV